MRTAGSGPAYNCKKIRRKQGQNGVQTQQSQKRWTQAVGEPPKEDREASSDSHRNRLVQGASTRNDALRYLNPRRRMRGSCRGIKGHEHRHKQACRASHTDLNRGMKRENAKTKKQR